MRVPIILYFTIIHYLAIVRTASVGSPGLLISVDFPIVHQMSDNENIQQSLFQPADSALPAGAEGHDGLTAASSQMSIGSAGPLFVPVGGNMVAQGEEGSMSAQDDDSYQDAQDGDEEESTAAGASATPTTDAYWIIDTEIGGQQYLVGEVCTNPG